ncbi:hypothetical protein [Ruegeria arenilitoris]|uniref:hypothetical protein n=1 Tax=Ruegeria arenilitoris TaxID=1173585 RepID=UPI00147A82EF|nr:hypothetical protein [Ruegeria arenilitoris]
MAVNLDIEELTEEQLRELEYLAGQVADALEGLQEPIVTLKEQLDELPDAEDVAGWASEIHSALDEGQNLFEGAAAQINVGFNRLQNAWQEEFAEHEARVAEELVRAKNNVEAVRNSVDNLGEQSDGFKDAVDKAEQIRQEEFAELETTVEAASIVAVEFLEGAASAAVDVIENVDGIVEGVKNEITEHLSGLDEFLQSEVADPLEELADELDERLTELRERMRDVVKAKTTELIDDDFVKVLQGQVDALADEIFEILRSHIAEIVQGGEDNKAQREQMEAARDVLETVIDPVLAALEHLRGLAGSVGISV